MSIDIFPTLFRFGHKFIFKPNLAREEPKEFNCFQLSKYFEENYAVTAPEISALEYRIDENIQKMIYLVYVNDMFAGWLIPEGESRDFSSYRKG
jgi:hypothetical protein